jgi:hypothetical protein
MVGLLWLRRGMVVLSSDELVAQTWMRLQSVFDRDAQQENPSYSSQRPASPAHSVSHRRGRSRLTAAEDMGRCRGRDIASTVT